MRARPPRPKRMRFSLTARLDATAPITSAIAFATGSLCANG